MSKELTPRLEPNRVTAIDLVPDGGNTNESSSKNNTYELPDADKVNNVVQKERELARAGVTRLKAFKVVAEALEAFTEDKVVDGEGRGMVIRKPNVPRQQWGAEMAAKYFGDFVKEKTEDSGGGIRSLVASERTAIQRRITTILQTKVTVVETTQSPTEEF